MVSVGKEGGFIIGITAKKEGKRSCSLLQQARGKPKIVQVLLVGCGNAVHILSAAMSHQFSSEFEFKVNILSTHAED